MIDSKEFKLWLNNNTEYSPAVIGDNVSRMKRADSIVEWSNDDTYFFYLEKESAFIELSVSVRSQLRKAVKLYSEYAKVLIESKGDVECKAL